MLHHGLDGWPVNGTMRPVKQWIIVNPTAGSRRALNAGQALERLLPGAELLYTSGPGDAENIARRAAQERVDVVVAVGGDGTIHECASGLCLDSSGNFQKSGTQLAVLPAGTGGDYQRTFGWNGSPEAAAARIGTAHARAVDVGRVEYQSPAGRAVSIVANIMTFGLGGLTDRIVERGPKWLGGRAAFFLGALRANAIYRPVVIDLFIDGALVGTAPYSNVAVCIGKYCGGGMKMAPDADPSDGLFDIVTAEMNKLQTAALSTSIYRGKHLNRAGVHHYRGKAIEARLTAGGESLIDVDGEQLGTLPLRCDLIPGGLSLLV